MENLFQDYAKGLIDAFKFNYINGMYQRYIDFVENGCEFNFSEDLQIFQCEIRYENDLGEFEYEYRYLQVDEKYSIKEVQKFIEECIEEFFELNP